MSTPVVPVFIVPSVAIFVRHSASCPHVGDETYKRCKCRKHLRWSYGAKQYRRSAKTRSWVIAEDRRRSVEATFEAANTPGISVGDVAIESTANPTLERAVSLFLTDKKSQGLSDDFLSRYKRELGRLTEFMERRSVIFPQQMKLTDLTEFRAEWNVQYPSSTTRSKAQERLRSFLRYCYNAKMIDRVPRLSPIRIDEPPTMPLTDAEYEQLLKTIPEEFTGRKATRVHALVQLMRWSGLAIQDSVTLEQSELQSDGSSGPYRVETSRQKTGTHVSVRLPPEVAREILAAMKLNSNPKFAFWSGNGKVKTALSNWGNVLRQLFRAAGFPEGHPHQLRDTFAVHLLQKGVPIEEVSKALGHDSLKTTEKHYAKWVKSRQDRLDSLVVATWDEPVSKPVRRRRTHAQKP